jgi:hypothetical protein
VVVLFVLIAFLAFHGGLIRDLLRFNGVLGAIAFFGKIGVTVLQQRVLIAMAPLLSNSSGVFVMAQEMM